MEKLLTVMDSTGGGQTTNVPKKSHVCGSDPGLCLKSPVFKSGSTLYWLWDMGEVV